MKKRNDMKSVKGYRIGEDIPDKAKFLCVKKQEIKAERRVKYGCTIHTFELVFYYEFLK